MKKLFSVINVVNHTYVYDEYIYYRGDANQYLNF